MWQRQHHGVIRWHFARFDLPTKQLEAKARRSCSKRRWTRYNRTHLRTVPARQIFGFSMFEIVTNCSVSNVNNDGCVIARLLAFAGISVDDTPRRPIDDGR
jgi:hypothetical protein